MAIRKTTAVAKPNPTSLANIRSQLQAEVQNLKEQIGKPSGNKIKLKDKTFVFPDGSVDEGPINVVVIDFVSRNKFYATKYNPNDPSPPDCFAVSRKISEMKPSPDSPSPQAASCAECPLNQFGSDGKGKACKNTRFLAVIPPDEVSPTAELMTIEVSPTAVKNFDATVSTVEKLYGLPPIGVSLDVSFNPNEDYSTLIFSNPQENSNLEAHFARRADAETILMAEPDFTQAAAPAPAPKSRARVAPTRKVT